MNAYELLGLRPGADVREIELARRRELSNAHPDRNPDDPSAHERFIAVQAAYEILSDTQMRQRYDAVHLVGSESVRVHAGGAASRRPSPEHDQWPQYWIVQGMTAPRRTREDEWVRMRQEIDLMPTSGPDPRRTRLGGYRDLFDPAFDRRLLDQLGSSTTSAASASIRSLVVGNIDELLRNMRHLRGSRAGIETGRQIVGHRAWAFVCLESADD